MNISITQNDGIQNQISRKLSQIEKMSAKKCFRFLDSLQKCLFEISTTQIEKVGTYKFKQIFFKTTNNSKKLS